MQEEIGQEDEEGEFNLPEKSNFFENFREISPNIS
jgi:hypothetical protein